MKPFRQRRKEYSPKWGKVSDRQGCLLGLWVDKPPPAGEGFGIILAIAQAESEAPDPLGRINPDLGYRVAPSTTGDRQGFFVMFACKDQSTVTEATEVAYFAAPGD